MINRIATILGSKAVLKIDFQLDQTRVIGSGLVKVLVYVNLKQAGQAGIKIKFGPMSDDVAAYYDPRRNVFNFRRASYGQTDFQRMTIVHECVHAWLDVRMPTIRTEYDAVAVALMTTTHLSDEAAAYVAGALFFIYEITLAGGTPALPDKWKSFPIYVEAYRIATKIMNRPGVTVPAADANALKKMIIDSGDYPSIASDPARMAGNDGV